MTPRTRPLFLAFAAVAFAGLSVAYAQTTTSNMTGLKLSGDQPVNIESDQLEVHQQDNTANFTGNVSVVQGTTHMTANDMLVHYKGKGEAVSNGQAKIDTIDVSGNVVITTDTQKATADKGHFDMNSQIATLEGDRVVLTEGNNIFVGCKLIVHMQTGVAKLDSCGRRVQIQLDPKSQQTPTPKKKP
ncbi:hypothetical protein NAC44_04445 [Allorhizobium sp. BGMRC 0089]|uniref:LptA/OstA family protein n=1 Tax=Allorhizobium sonneratiae TaxID=2934936 RepID=UPI0020339F46|nr:LptA/OstA family protein [Allorhizobium sonneratiae]MCM2291576.1 hypothetical protein [Allorhizobium sonneratiae]